jgi:hypothetical protein
MPGLLPQFLSRCGSPPRGGDCGRLTACTSLKKLLIGRGFLFLERVPVAKKLPRSTSLLWPSELISRLAANDVPFLFEENVFLEVVMLAGATRGTGSVSARGSGWARLDVNREDPVEKKEIPYREGKMKDIGAHVGYTVL